MRTLPKREIATGMGEIIKYGVIYDPDFFLFGTEPAGRAEFGTGCGDAYDSEIL